METPSIPDNDGEFCWEMDVDLKFRLEEHLVFIVVFNPLFEFNKKKKKKFLYILFSTFSLLVSPGMNLYYPTSPPILSFFKLDIWMIFTLFQ